MDFMKIGSFDGLDKKKFRKLAESGFGKTLVPEYFEYCKPEYIVVCSQNEGYLGVIVVEKIPESDNVHYLDKIVVSKEMQGTGLGKKLWQYLNGDSEKLVWRAKKYNPINRFYKEQSQHMQELPEWIVYWYGLSQAEIKTGTDYAISKKATLKAISDEKNMKRTTQNLSSPAYSPDTACSMPGCFQVGPVFYRQHKHQNPHYQASSS